MSEGGTLVAPTSALADGNSGASQVCIPGPRDRWQESTGSYTEAELWLYRDRTMGLLRRYDGFRSRRDVCPRCWGGSCFGQE